MLLDEDSLFKKNHIKLCFRTSYYRKLKENNIPYNFFYKYNEPYDKLMSVMEKIKAIQGTVFILINAHIPKNAQPPDLETKSAIIKYSYHQVAMKIYYV